MSIQAFHPNPMLESYKQSNVEEMVKKLHIQQEAKNKISPEEDSDYI
jgi:hypothetical protein